MLKKWIIALICCVSLYGEDQLDAQHNIQSSSNLSSTPGLDAIFRTKSFGCEGFAISPNGKYLCYPLIDTTSKKENSEITHIPGKTPFIFVGSSLYLRDLARNEAIRIGPSGNCWMPSWSPDNKKIAFYSDTNTAGSSRVWVYELESARCYPVIDHSLHSHLSHSLTWDHDSKHLYVFIAAEKALSQSPEHLSLASVDLSTQTKDAKDISLCTWKNLLKCELARVDIYTGVICTLVPLEAPNAPLHIQLSPSGDYLAYLSLSDTKLKATFKSNYDLSLLNRKDNSSLLIDEALASSFLNDRCYKWHPKENRLFYLKEGRLFSLSEKNSFEVTELYPNREERFLGKPFFFSEDGKWLIIGMNPSFQQYSDRPSSIAVISLDTLAIKTLTWNLEKTFLDPLWDSKSNRLIIRLMSSSGEVELIMHSIPDMHAETLWKGHAKLHHTTIHQGMFFTQMETLDTPIDIHKWNLGNKTWEPITHINPLLDSISPPRKEQFQVEIPIYDGSFRTVTTTVLLPSNVKETDKIPAIVLLYPGANLSAHSREFCGGGDLNYALLEKGYAIILPDCPLDFLNHPGHPINAIIDALVPQIYAVCNQGRIDIHKLGILGHSYGGYGAAAVISRTHLFRAAAALCGIYDLGGAYGYIDDVNSFFGVYWSEHSQGGMGVSPWEGFLRYIDNSPYYLAENITTPLLLVHGNKDQTCFVQEAQKMFTALMRLNKTARLLVYPGGHRLNDWPKEEARDAAQHILEHFDRYVRLEK